MTTAAMADTLEGYEIEFRQNALFGTWFWTATAPNGDKLTPLVGVGFLDKRRAEQDALRRIRMDQRTEKVNGAALEQRLTERSSAFEAAFDAAFPGLPECMSIDEAKRRVAAAVIAWDQASGR